MKLAIFLLALSSTILTFFVFLPFSQHITNALPDSVDPLFYAWNLSHNIQSATHGFADLLDTNIFYPETNTLAFSDTLFAQTVMTAPVLVLTQNPVLAENLYVLATFPLSAIAMFFLAYYLTRHAWASALAGLFFAFSYPRLSQIGHLPAISSQWLPLVFLSLIQYLRELRFTHLALMFFWFLLTITSTVYFGIFLIPLVLIIILFEAKIALIQQYLRDVAILILPALVILFIVLFPYIRLRAEYSGIKRSLEDSARLSAVPRDYASVLPTSWLSDLGFPTNTNERALSLTATLLIVAAGSIITADKRHRKTIWIFNSVAIVAFVLSLGPYVNGFRMPYYYLYKMFPLLQSVRVPARWSIFVVLGLAVSAAFALSRVLVKPQHKVIGLSVALLFLTEIWQTRTPFITVPLKDNLPPVYEMIINAPDDSIIVELPFHPEWTGSRMENQLQLTYEEVTENDVYALEAYRTYFSAFHGKRMLNGYSGYFPNVYHDHASVFDKFPTPEAIAALEKRRVRYILIHASQYVNDSYSDIERKIKRYPELTLVAQFGTDYVYEVR